jgi:hypothetical protein
MPARYRADLADVSWAKEHTYAQMPPVHATNPQYPLGPVTNAGGTSVTGEMRGQWGLVTGGVDLPTPTFDWQPFYGLGVMNRNMLFPVQGRERLEGRVGQSLLCHESSRLWLEQCFGLLFNAKNSDVGMTDVNTYTATSGTATVTATDFTITGEDFSAWKPTGSAPPTHIIIVSDTAGAASTDIPNRTQDTWAYIGPGGGNTVMQVYKSEDLATANAGWNGIRPPGGANTRFSVHGIGIANNDVAATDTNNMLNVTRDLNAGKHLFVRPTLVQPSFTLGARFRADDGSFFLTNYTGCKISRVVFNFEEGNPVNFGSDFIARDMSHNVGEHDSSGTGVETMKYKAQGATAQSSGEAATTIPPSYMKNIRVTEQPYFFSTVSLTFHGDPIARFRRFTLTMDNGLDPRYYISQNDAGSPRDNRQILSEILEGRRNISFGGSLDLDDDGSSAYPVAASPTDASFLRMLLNQGFTGADVRDQNLMKGIGITIELRQVSDYSASTYDKIKFHIGPTNNQTNEQNNIGDVDDVGMIIRSAPHNVPAPPSIHIPVDIDGMASSMFIEIMDGVAATD